MWVPGGGKNAWNLRGGREKRVEPSRIYSTKSTQSAWGPRIAWKSRQSSGLLLLICIITEADHFGRKH